MIIDQSEIDSLLEEASGLAAEAADTTTMAPAPPAPPPAPTPCTFKMPTDPNVRRLLRLRVPVIVQLASRPMPISNVRDLSVGAIIEFEKSVEDPLDLLINNRLIGQGQCVKVGENFGLRVTRICDTAQRIRSMGGD
ncbi:MAG TPA: FliM/FliN family flagellar motor switch protein [Phycisphaerae bacterium]|nr:FliM/FliN family flagellar motor switch protein [Phycisphaerae bacterium]HPM22460.1 FliM/FliN family flagellar motor switch protein [Phycisphaerae bacterium]